MRRCSLILSRTSWREDTASSSFGALTCQQSKRRFATGYPRVTRAHPTLAHMCRTDHCQPSRSRTPAVAALCQCHDVQLTTRIRVRMCTLQSSIKPQLYFFFGFCVGTRARLGCVAMPCKFSRHAYCTFCYLQSHLTGLTPQDHRLSLAAARHSQRASSSLNKSSSSVDRPKRTAAAV